MADDDEDERFVQRQSLRQNLVAFWILGLCNNFAYVVMLSAAKDILGEHDNGGSGNGTGDSGKCIDRPDEIKYSATSTGAILLADIIPCLIAKLISFFLVHSIAYSVRHGVVLFCQCVSLLLVAFSESFFTSILGVIFASAGSGLGEVAYLSLTSHFHGDVIASWSSGTGGAGIVGALAFAIMTDHRLLGLSPRITLLLMLTVPAVLFYTFWKILVFPSTLHTFDIWRVSTYLVPRDINIFDSRPLSRSDTIVSASSSVIDVNVELMETPLLLAASNHTEAVDDWFVLSSRGRLTNYLRSRLRVIKPLLKYMIPLVIVYFAEYFINQGLLELLVFTCSQGFNLSPTSQYRWYQVLYQVGVFVSRSSAKIFSLNPLVLPVLPVLQVINAGYLFNKSMHPSNGHIAFVFVLVFYEGLLGGAAYVNTFNTIHKTVQRNRELSMSFVAISDALGIVVAGFTGIWAHNFICARFRLF